MEKDIGDPNKESNFQEADEFVMKECNTVAQNIKNDKGALDRARKGNKGQTVMKEFVPINKMLNMRGKV